MAPNVATVPVAQSQASSKELHSDSQVFSQPRTENGRDPVESAPASTVVQLQQVSCHAEQQDDAMTCWNGTQEGDPPGRSNERRRVALALARTSVMSVRFLAVDCCFQGGGCLEQFKPVQLRTSTACKPAWQHYKKQNTP